MISLRRARLADVPLLEAWDKEPHVIAASGDDDVWDWPAAIAQEVDWQWLYMAQLGARPIGMVQIIDPAREETHYWGDVPPGLRAIDIWIGPPSALGKGYGSEMMAQAFALCFAAPHVTAILIDPLARNTRAIAFYERLGFQHMGQQRFGDDDCAVMRLERGRWLSQRGAR